MILSRPVITSTAFAGVGGGPVGIGGAGGRFAIDPGFGEGTGIPFEAGFGADIALSDCNGSDVVGAGAVCVPVSPGDGVGGVADGDAVDAGVVSV